MNVDRLSYSEALRIRKFLADISILVDHVVINRLKPDDSIAAITEEFDSRIVSVLPMAGGELVGLPALQNYLTRFRHLFADKMAVCQSINPCVPS